jgi:alkane 1-monooxygenase
MKNKLLDLAYLAAYVVPLLAIIGLQFGGVWSWSVFVFAFVLIPILDSMLPDFRSSYSKKEQEIRKARIFFDVLLYFNVVLVYGVIVFFVLQISSNSFSRIELLGHIISLGIVLGSNGINVAHELGHRADVLSKLAAKLLLLPSFYMHFIIEHNQGHHKNVATLNDPATARLNETYYAFWLRSVMGSYIHAWKLNAQIIQRKYLISSKIWHYQMFYFTILELSYVLIIYFWKGPLISFYCIVAGVIAFSLLELINYIEHYGLLRKKNEFGRYERVGSQHSWNSDKLMGRIVLYELTRHSDHHFRTNKKFQNLESKLESPQLPLGYPGSMLLSLVPPLWFRKVNPIVQGSKMD